MTKRILSLGLTPIHDQAGGEITHWPIIQIIPRPITEPALQHALLQFDHYSHVIITSKSTVKILHDYLPRLGISWQQWTPKITIAVGQATAKHLERYGIQPARVAQEETAEGIIHELTQIPLEQAHLFWPHSSRARPVLREFLISQHLCYTDCALYDPQPQIPSDRPLLHTFDEIIFTSPSTVEAFLTIFGGFPQRVRLTPIGPVTARYLEEQQKRHSKLA